MLKQHATIFRRLMIFTDLCITAGAFFLAYYVRDRNDALCPLIYLLWLLVLFVTLWGFFLRVFGMYSSFRLKKITEVFFIIYQSAYLVFFIFAGFCYAFKIAHISRIFVFLAFVFAMFFLVMEKLALVLFFRRLREKGFNYKNVLIVGTGQRARNFIRSVNRHRELGLRIIGLISSEDVNEVGEIINGCKVLGMIKDIPDIVNSNILDQVIFIVPYSFFGKIEESMRYLETVGIKADIAMDYFSLKLARAQHSEFLGVHFLSFASTQEKVLLQLIKRLFDITASFAGLVLLSPVFLAASLLIKITSKAKNSTYSKN